MKEKNSLLSNEEKTSCRSAVGQLNWLAGKSRSDIRFSVIEARGGSQAGQIIFLTDGKSNTCPLWNYSKIKRVLKSTKAAEALPFLEGCDVAMFINKLVSELLLDDEKQLNIIAYTNNRSLYHAMHSLKQTLQLCAK